jgi:hypothetical protein
MSKAPHARGKNHLHESEDNARAPDCPRKWKAIPLTSGGSKFVLPLSTTFGSLESVPQPLAHDPRADHVMQSAASTINRDHLAQQLFRIVFIRTEEDQFPAITA